MTGSDVSKILETLRCNFSTVGDRFGDPGVRRNQQAPIEFQISIFIDFGVHLGSPLGTTLETFPSFVCDLGWHSGESVQGNVFNDPGLEMLPECGG